MQIHAEKFNGRIGWRLSNDKLDLIVLAGGGHIAGLFLKDGPKINPYWVPHWRTIEPWQYRAELAKKYGVKLLAAIYGHNVCLGVFGGPSADEERAGGPGCHGEAPVMRWRVLRRDCSRRQLRFVYGCRLPEARMALERAISMQAGSDVINIRETVFNLSRCDKPFTMCQHVSLGAPFVEPEVTVFDLSGKAAHSFPGKFGNPQRLKQDVAFHWPEGVGPRGKVNLRTMQRAKHGDFYAVLMNPKQERAWFSALHPKHGLLIAYSWQRADYPWTGIWEENHARTAAPWLGRELVRGMEFTNTPFPISLRYAVDLGHYQGQPAFRWLPARGKVTFAYSIVARKVDRGAKGVTKVEVDGYRAEIILI